MIAGTTDGMTGETTAGMIAEMTAETTVIALGRTEVGMIVRERRLDHIKMKVEIETTAEIVRSPHHREQLTASDPAHRDVEETQTTREREMGKEKSRRVSTVYVSRGCQTTWGGKS